MTITTDTPFADTVATAYAKSLTDVANGMEISLSRFIDPTQFAAIQAGSSTYDAFTDLQTAFNSGAKCLFAPAGVYRFTGDLTLPEGVMLRGAGGGEYIMLLDGNAQNTVFERQDAGSAADSAVLTLGNAATVENLQVRPANWQAVDYAAANYPANTGNVPIGVKMGISCQARHVTAVGFPVSAFRLGTTAVMERCYAYCSDKGFDLDPTGATDGMLLNCIGMFCHHAGADLVNNYWQVLGGRYEWNARYGVIMGAENTCVGATFDRNGFAGIWAAGGHWGKVIAGNYFSRNGCGGDGTSGRWDFSTPGNGSYLAVPAGESCHILIDYEHATTITGNRFRAGSDDSGAGANGPQFIYSSGAGSAPGATPISGLAIVGNMGDKPDHQVQGYVSNYGGVANSGAPAGGTDGQLAYLLNTGAEFATSGIASRLHCGDQSPSQSASSLVVKVLRNTSGRITVRAVSGTTTNLFDVYFASNGADAGYTTAIANLLGTSTVNTAVMTQDTTDSRYNKVTINLKASYYAAYAVYST